MFVKEIMGVFKDRRALLFIVIFMAIMLADVYMGYEQGGLYEKRQNEEELKAYDEEMRESSEQDGANWVSGWIVHPAKASVLSGYPHGQIVQMLIFWLLPVFLLNIYSDRYISERIRGYTNAIYVREGRYGYMLKKIAASFCISSVVMFICLIINFGVVQFVFRGGTSFAGLEYSDSSLINYQVTNPNRAYMLHLIMASLVAGLCGVICQCTAMICKKYSTVYIVSMLIWFALIMYKFPVTDIFQPFVQESYISVVYSFAVLTAVTFIMLAANLIMRKKIKDEI